MFETERSDIIKMSRNIKLHIQLFDKKGVQKTSDLATQNIIDNTSFFQLKKYEKKYKKYYKRHIFVLALSFKMIICLSIDEKHIFLDKFGQDYKKIKGEVKEQETGDLRIH